MVVGERIKIVHKLVLADSKRFDPDVTVGGTTCVQLHKGLSNQDLALAIPDARKTAKTTFGATHALQWKRLLDSWQKSLCAATRHCAMSMLLLQGPSSGSLLVARSLTSDKDVNDGPDMPEKQDSDNLSLMDMHAQDFRQRTSAYVHAASLRTKCVMVRVSSSSVSALALVVHLLLVGRLW